MDKELNDLKAMLRALVVSSSCVMDARSLARAYYNRMGAPVPAGNFGCENLLEFLRAHCVDCFLFQGDPSNPTLVSLENPKVATNIYTNMNDRHKETRDVWPDPVNEYNAYARKEPIFAQDIIERQNPSKGTLMLELLQRFKDEVHALIKEHEYGVLCGDIMWLYKQKYNRDLPPLLMHFNYINLLIVLLEDRVQWAREEGAGIRLWDVGTRMRLAPPSTHTAFTPIPMPTDLTPLLLRTDPTPLPLPSDPTTVPPPTAPTPLPLPTNPTPFPLPTKNAPLPLPTNPTPLPLATDPTPFPLPTKNAPLPLPTNPTPLLLATDPKPFPLSPDPTSLPMPTDPTLVPLPTDPTPHLLPIKPALRTLTHTLQHSVPAARPQHTAVAPRPQHTAVAKRTQHTTVDPRTQHTAVALHPQHTAVAPLPQHTAVAPRTQHTTMAPRTHHTAVAPRTQHTAVAPRTQHTSVAPRTQHTAVAPRTQHTSVAPRTQHTAVAPRLMYTARAPQPLPSMAAPLPYPSSHDAAHRAPWITCDLDVFPLDCMQLLEVIPTKPVARAVPGAILPVVVAEVYSPSHFWLQILGIDQLTAMDIHMHKMRAYYMYGAGRLRWLQHDAIRVGYYCAALYRHEWHRSLIVQIVDMDTIKVRYIDFGTVETVEARSLKPLRREWSELPAQALRARLAGVQPIGGANRWPRNAAVAFQRRVHLRHVYARIMAVDAEDGALEMFVIDTSGPEDVCVSSTLVMAGYAAARYDLVTGRGANYMFPLFSTLESGATPTFTDIQRYMARIQWGLLLSHLRFK